MPWPLRIGRPDSASSIQVLSQEIELIRACTQCSYFAHAVLSAHVILAEGLALGADCRPERHVNVIGWSTEEHAQFSKATVLAKLASCTHVWP
jgi:hypothetical protein